MKKILYTLLLSLILQNVCYGSNLNRIQRDITNNTAKNLEQNETDNPTKRQIFPGNPVYAPSSGCGPGGFTACAFPPGTVYNPVGCAPPIPAALPPPFPSPPVLRVPLLPPPSIPTGRLIPQALPGAPCEPGVECTGGSVCSIGICLCPPELVQEGTVCVSRTVYGVLPPPPIGGASIAPPPAAVGPILPAIAPPPPPPPGFAPPPASFAPPPPAAFAPFPAAIAPPSPLPAFASLTYSSAYTPPLPTYPPLPSPVRSYQPLPIASAPPPPAPITLVGGPCGPGGCLPGGFCDSGFCNCGPGFAIGFDGSCVQKAHRQPFSLDGPELEE